MLENIPKVYTHGVIGQGEQITKAFEKLGVDNPTHYKFNDPWVLYYADRNSHVAMVEPNTDLYYSIVSSNEWKELKIKQPKKTHSFLITVREGASSCEGCHAANKCSPEQKCKCQLAALLNELTKCNELTGKILEIKEINTSP